MSFVYDDPWIQILIQLCGAFWLLAYALIIKRGFQDRSCGMPMLALAFNVCWEAIFGFLRPDAPPMDTVNRVWFAVDLVIAAQYLRFGRPRFPKEAPSWLFAPSFLAAVGMFFVLLWTFTVQFDDASGAWSAWTSNLAMSGLFLWWVLDRADVAGQSIYIAISKAVGTLGIDLAQHQLTPDDLYLQALYGAVFLLDLAYIVLLHQKLRRLGLNPWRRL